MREAPRVEVWYEYEYEPGSEDNPANVKKMGLARGQKYYTHKGSGQVNAKRPSGVNVKVVSWEEVQLRRKRREDKLEKRKWCSVPFDYSNIAKQELAQNEGRLRACYMKLKIDQSNEVLQRERKRLKKLVEGSQKALKADEAATARRDAIAKNAKRHDVEQMLEMDMAEAWVHEHGDEDAEDRSGDLEKFFKQYEANTGGSTQNGVLHGIETEFCGWERYTKGFGSRMLESFGYEKGLGLGSRAHGIVEPVQALKFKAGAGLDYINTAKVKNIYKQDAAIGVQLREAAQKVREATGECGDTEWQGAFNLANAITIKDDGAVVKNVGRVTSWASWKQARAEERKVDDAVDAYNRLTKGEKAVEEKKVTKTEKAKAEAVEEAQDQRLRITFLQRRMKDAQKAYERNRLTDKNIAAQAKAIVDECKAELGEAQKDASAAEGKMHTAMKKAKKFKF